MLRLKKKSRPLLRIDEKTINNGVLTIDDGVTFIDNNIDRLLERSNVHEPVIAVVFPRSLQRLEGFFTNNKSVKLVVFNSNVDLTTYNTNAGVFEGSEITTIAAPAGGFKYIDDKIFKGTVIDESTGNIAVDGQISPHFINCNMLKQFIVGVSGHNNVPEQLISYNAIDSYGKPYSWQHIRSAMFSEKLVITSRQIRQVKVFNTSYRAYCQELIETIICSSIKTKQRSL